MNRFAFSICVFAMFVAVVKPTHAAFNNSGDLIILGTDTNADAATAASAITLYDFSYSSLIAAGNSPQTLPVQALPPVAHSISGLTLPGANDHDGLLHLSTDGNYLTFAGYQAAVNTPSLVTSGSPHKIGVVDSSWNLTTVSVSNYTNVSLRSIVSTDGKHFWTGGDQGTDGGQYYIDNSSGSPTQTLVNTGDARGNRIVNNQLYGFSSSTGGTNFGASLPTTSTAEVTAFDSSFSPFVKSDAIFLDLNNDGTDETAYTTDGKNLLAKWHYNGSIWSEIGSWSGTKANINNINSLEAYVYNGNVELLAATQIGQLFKFEDTNGINNNFSFTSTTPTPIFSIGGTDSFRGMAVVPVPEPTTITLLVLAIPFVIGCRRWRGRRCDV